MAQSKRPTMSAGLKVLLGETTAMSQAPITANTLPLGALKPGSGQPRREFDKTRLQELATSIKEQGVLQPLLVRPITDGYEIVAGERRWRAAQLAGLAEVPVVVRELDDLEARQIALIENLQRENLNTVDEVDAKLELVAATLRLTRDEARSRLMQLLREAPGEDHAALDRLFAVLGEQWQSFTRNKLKILKWPEAVLDAVRSGMSYSLGAVIASAPEHQQAHLIQYALAGASLNDLKAEARRLTERPQERPQATRVGRVLSSARWLDKLNAEQERAVNDWLATMPDVVRQALAD